MLEKDYNYWKIYYTLLCATAIRQSHVLQLLRELLNKQMQTINSQSAVNMESCFVFVLHISKQQCCYYLAPSKQANLFVDTLCQCVFVAHS